MAEAGTDDIGILQRLDLDMIDTEPQIRKSFDEDDLQELARSLAAVGQVVPICVRPLTNGRYMLVAGERRVRAARALGWSHIVATVRPMDDEQVWVDRWIENACRKDINPIEQAFALQEYMDRSGLCAAELARRLGMRETTLRSRLLLLRLPPDMQHVIAAGELPAAYGEYMGRLDRDAQWRAWEYLIRTPNPHLGTFRELCQRLKDASTCPSTSPSTDITPSAMTTGMLFSLEPFVAPAVGATTDSAESVVRGDRYPERQNLPPMPTAASVGVALQRYIEELSTSNDPGHREAALVVGFVYNSLRSMHLIRR